MIKFKLTFIHRGYPAETIDSFVAEFWTEMDAIRWCQSQAEWTGAKDTVEQL
jgi:hypothetical protein